MASAISSGRPSRSVALVCDVAQRRPRRFLGDVGVYERRGPTGRADAGRHLLADVVDIGQRHRPPVVGQPHGGGGTDTVGRAGDDGDPGRGCTRIGRFGHGDTPSTPTLVRPAGVEIAVHHWCDGVSRW